MIKILSSHFIGEITEQQVALEFLKQANGDKYKMVELLNEKLDYNNRKTTYAYNEVCKEVFSKDGYWGMGVGIGAQGHLYYNFRLDDGQELHIGYDRTNKKAFTEHHYGY